MRVRFGRPRLFGWLLWALLAAVACRGAPSELVVVVNSDLSVPDQLDAVKVTVTGPANMPVETSQALGAPGSPGLPLTLGVSPAGGSLGPIEVVAEGSLQGTVVVTRSARTSLVQGEKRVLYLMLLAACRGVDCAQGETCTARGCASENVDPSSLPRWTGHVPGLDAGAVDAKVADGGMSDGSAPDASVIPCTSTSQCDDHIDCTVDVCSQGLCTFRPSDGACTASSGGTCDPQNGCQYPSCTSDNCSAQPCQTAQCVSDHCQRTNLCTTGQMCCGGSCVPAGCDDGNPCTDDSCGASGCVHTNNDASCDDGTFCNGPDTCGGGSCSVHAGSPCAGSAVCDEGMSRCTGCLVDSDCGAPVNGSWGSCMGYSDTCDQSGTQTRSVTSYTCNNGTCVSSMSTDSQPCTRTTDGNGCGTTTCAGWGSCGGFSGTCDQSGTHSRTCTDQICSSGTCGSSMRTESASCSRSTDGTTCGTTTCGAYGSCGGFSGTCGQSGTQSRTCTDYACSSGMCASSTRTDTASCSRSTDGTTCGTTTCGSWSTCSYSSTCAESGSQTRTCTSYACSGGSCASTSTTPSQSCSRTTNGDTCSDGNPCTTGDACSGGTCYGTPISCPTGQRCLAGMCMCLTC